MGNTRKTWTTSCRAIALTLPLLAGCTYASVGEVRELTPEGSAFAGALSSEYKKLALYEADQMTDWIDAEHFADKGMDAARGQVRGPDMINQWDIEDDKKPELNAARERLVTFLNAGAGDQSPRQVAKAQASFDCWLEQQEEKWQTDHIALCRDAFYAAIENVEPIIKPQATIHFGLDSGVMDNDAHAALNKFANYVRKFDTGAVVIDGHADRAGTDPYNLDLSQKRALAVRKQLIRAGVPSDRIHISVYGESSPAVTTPDGMIEPLNRRAEVALRLPPLYANIAPPTELATVSE